MTARSVLVVEDEPATRARLAGVLQRDPRFTLAGTAGDLAGARALLRRAGAPDVALVDLGLPDGDGTELIAELQRVDPAPAVMVITVFGDEKHVVAAIRAGATGYLLKDASAEEIGDSIQDLLAGGSPISPSVARYLLKALQAGAPAAERAVRGADAVTLTARETETLQHVARGHSYAEIAAILGISVNTVGYYVKEIYRKLAVNSRGEAVYKAQAQGLIEPPRG